MPKLNKTQAYSLIELLCAIAISGILVFISLPAMQTLLGNSSALAHAEKIIAALQTARGIAISQNMPITFCKSGDTQKCSGEWRDGQIIVDAQGKILRVFPAIPKQDKLIWNSSRGADNAVIFLPSGYSNGQQGSFYYCAGKQPGLAIILEQTGRIRVDNKTAEGKTVSCQ